MADLPKEIMEDILSRLPAKSLVRFTSVSKHWRSFISDPNFVQKHLNHVLLDQSNDHQRLILRSASQFHSIDYESLKASAVQRDLPFQAPSSIQILGSCNGLLCVGFNDRYLGYETIVLWNPLLSDYKMLPDSNLFSGAFHILGFGYDSSVDDYKVVRIIANSRYICKLKHEVEIYSLKSNSWKKIQDVPFNATFENPVIGTHVNGSIYWHVSQFTEKDMDCHMIACFDLVDERFRLVELPLDFEEMWAACLMAVRGCLGMFQRYFGFPKFAVWIMKADEKNEVWSKLMEIPYPEGMFSEPVCVMNYGEVLISVSHNVVASELSLITLGEFTRARKNFVGKEQKLVVYNPERGTFRNVSFHGTRVWHEEATCIETLVSPNGGGW